MSTGDFPELSVYASWISNKKKRETQRLKENKLQSRDAAVGPATETETTETSRDKKSMWAAGEEDPSTIQTLVDKTSQAIKHFFTTK